MKECRGCIVHCASTPSGQIKGDQDAQASYQLVVYDTRAMSVSFKLLLGLLVETIKVRNSYARYANSRYLLIPLALNHISNSCVSSSTAGLQNQLHFPPPHRLSPSGCPLRHRPCPHHRHRHLQSRSRSESFLNWCWLQSWW